MAIIIMEMIGKNHNNQFYPTFSGVAQSYNYYPVSHMERKQGVAFVAVGLGKTVADGKKSLRFSPYYPEILSQYYSPDTMLENSQNNIIELLKSRQAIASVLLKEKKIGQEETLLIEHYLKINNLWNDLVIDNPNINNFQHLVMKMTLVRQRKMEN